MQVTGGRGGSRTPLILGFPMGFVDIWDCRVSVKLSSSTGSIRDRQPWPKGPVANRGYRCEKSQPSFGLGFGLGGP